MQKKLFLEMGLLHESRTLPLQPFQTQFGFSFVFDRFYFYVFRHQDDESREVAKGGA